MKFDGSKILKFYGIYINGVLIDVRLPVQHTGLKPTIGDFNLVSTTVTCATSVEVKEVVVKPT